MFTSFSGSLVSRIPGAVHPDKTGDIVDRPIEIVVKCSFVLLKVIDVKEAQRTQNVFLSPQMFLAQFIHSINCGEHDR